MKLPSKLRHTVDYASTIDIAEDKDSKKRIHLNLAFQDLFLLVLGGLIVAFAVAVFIAPHDIAPGGSSGAAIILNQFVPIPIGVLMLMFNIPSFLLGYRKLGGSSFLIRSVIGTAVYNVSVDVMGRFVPPGGLTQEMLLNAVFGGIIGGIGVGLIYRAGGVAGAGGVVTRLLRQKFSWPISTLSLFTNGIVVLAAGFVFGWVAAMYAVISFFVSGAASDFMLEGPDVVQTAMIITDYPDRISREIAAELQRGTTRWEVRGQRDGHTALYCTVGRPEVSTLKNIVAAVDKEAFLIIGRGHEAVGKGFKAHQWRPPVVEQIQKADEE
ncbi:MAG: YitT family protein [Anaerolineales bacterium]|nr:YitT family protein [Anaerolineales bacterium]